MRKVKISARLEPELIKFLDDLARKNNQVRSKALRAVVRQAAEKTRDKSEQLTTISDQAPEVIA